MTAWKNDPLQAYDVIEPSLYAMTGDRRTAVVLKGPDGRHRFCAESLPDAVAAFSASTKAAAALDTKGNVSLDERAIAGLLQTFQRTESAGLYRQMGWNACIAWAQGGITDPQYFEILKTMTTEGLSAIATRVNQPLQPVGFHSGFLVQPGGSEAGASIPSGKPEDKPDRATDNEREEKPKDS